MPAASGLPLQKQRRLFLAGKGMNAKQQDKSGVHARRSSGKGVSSHAADPASAEDFEKMRRDVQLLGE
jgi:hypothetical protein